MSTFSGDIGREEEDGGGWEGLLPDKKEMRYVPSTPVAAPKERPCPHVTLKRQNCGSAHWYICHECEQKFKAVEWDGAVRVLTPLSELVDKITPENLHPEQGRRRNREI